MTTKTLNQNPATGLLITSILAAFLAGTGLAAAQVADDPPGSAYQTQGIREANGQRATPSVFSRTARTAAHTYAYIPASPAPRHKIVRSHR